MGNNAGEKRRGPHKPGLNFLRDLLVKEFADSPTDFQTQIKRPTSRFLDIWRLLVGEVPMYIQETIISK
jgi:hypothetical protein